MPLLVLHNSLVITFSNSNSIQHEFGVKLRNVCCGKNSPSQHVSADFGHQIPDSTGESSGEGPHRSTGPVPWLDPRRWLLGAGGSAEKDVTL